MPGGSRKYLFTIFYFDDEQGNNIPVVAEDRINFGNPVVRYMVYQVERCPDTGRIHLQGFLTLRKSLSVGAVKKVVGSSSMHLTKPDGTVADNIIYCTKEASRLAGPFEHGEKPLDGSAPKVLKELHTKLKSGLSLKRIIQDDEEGIFFGSYIRSFRGLEKYTELIAEKSEVKDSDREVAIFYGSPGSGKTYAATNSSTSLYKKPVNSKWYDKYDGETTLLLDEFSGWIQWNELLTIIDKYPVHVEMKGSIVRAKWTKVIITCNRHPALWYDPLRFPFEALTRRITEWHLFWKIADARQHAWFSNFEEFEVQRKLIFPDALSKPPVEHIC